MVNGNERPYVLRPGMILRHYRTNALYTVLYLSYLTTTAEDVVVYVANATGVVWVRPTEEFYDMLPQPGSNVDTPSCRFWPEGD